MTNLKEQSPLAFAAFAKWLDVNKSYHLKWDGEEWLIYFRSAQHVQYFPLPDQYLTEWLDLQGVYLSIISTDFGAALDRPFKFGWIIRQLNTPIIQDDGYLDSRPAAFTAAVSKGFSIINSHIEGETNEQN